MKQHLTIEDLMELHPLQRDVLRKLWQPQIYDLVCAVVCTDAENDTYQRTEFVIGDISVHQNHQDCTILLRDLTAMGAPNMQPGLPGAEPAPAVAAAPVFTEDDLQAGYQFEEYNKEDCLPLLNIGQLLELLQRKNYGNDYFYLTVPTTDDFICSVGRDGNAADYEQDELCDGLWECLKEKL